MKMRQAATNYLHANIGRLKSLKQDKPRVKRVCAHFKNTDIDKVGYWSIQHFVQKRQTEGCSNATINRDLSKLSAVFSFLMETEGITENPVKRSFYMKEYEKEVKIFTKEEYATLVTTPSPIQGIVLFAITAGLRHSEILRIHWKNINMDQRLIKVFNDTKTFKGRIIPMSKFLYEWLLKETNKTGFIFVSNKRKKKHKTTFAYLINTYLKHYPFERDGRGLQSMRHTYATMLVGKGVNIRIVQDLLGHSSLMTTMRYTHVDNEMKREAIERLEELI